MGCAEHDSMAEINPYQSPLDTTEAARQSPGGISLEKGLWYVCLIGAVLLVVGVLVLAFTGVILSTSLGSNESPDLHHILNGGGLASIAGTALISLSGMGIFAVRWTARNRRSSH